MKVMIELETDYSFDQVCERLTLLDIKGGRTGDDGYITDIQLIEE